MSAPGTAVPTDWRRAFDQCMLELLRGRPGVAQAPALVLQGLCQQAREQHTQSEPQVRMFWVLAGHFFAHLTQALAPAAWQNWHAVVCARIMAAAPGLAPMAPTPNQQAEALSAMFLKGLTWVLMTDIAGFPLCGRFGFGIGAILGLHLIFGNSIDAIQAICFFYL
jgi:hypothetical protein